MTRNVLTNTTRGLGVRIFMFLILTLGLISLSPAFAASGPEDHKKGHERPSWLDKLENQVNYEEVMGGMDGRQDRMNNTFIKLMDRLQDKIKEHATPASSGGGFHDSWSAHQLGQSYLLGPSEAAVPVSQGSHCPSSAPVKQYNVSAINVEIMLNQWGDYFPGYMYVLNEDIGKVRAEEKANAKSRDDELDPGMVSTGLQGDAIQPMTLRANQGDCLRVHFTNSVEDEDAGFQVNGSAMIISSSGLPASAASPGGIVKSGESQDFEWHIPVDEQEGTHLIQSNAGRDPQSLGLIGAFIVEPMGSTYLSPFDGKPTKNGWEVMIANDNARRSEERRVGKECRSRWSPYH